jgi:mRNA-degrading endonuclease RelE of RelBE toxin-antitoxin system
MHKIDKFLARLDAATRQKVLSIVERISSGDFSGLDMRKLKGSSDIYRVRLGKVRIKFVMNASGIRIFSIDKRGESTYRDV